jgi:phosphonate metabolism protein (transferase hexapeptide repeat family)
MSTAARLDEAPVEPGGAYVAAHVPEAWRAYMDRRSLEPKPNIHPDAMVHDSVLGPWTMIGARCVLSEVRFGAYSYIVNDASAVYADVGKFCSIAQSVRINPGNHPLAKAALHHFSYRSRSYQVGDADDAAFFEWRRAARVRIGNDVWIGHAAVILPGVTIGDGAAIGAGAVVSKDVAPYTIVAGVPARPIRERFPSDVQAGLQEIAWWDWPHDRIKAALEDFRSLDAAAFVAKHRA